LRSILIAASKTTEVKQTEVKTEGGENVDKKEVAAAMKFQKKDSKTTDEAENKVDKF
jgi:hypothetical protein